MTKITCTLGDITKVPFDAIVNAANSALLGGGGVDGAIHRAGGPAILEACRKIGGCKTGQAVVTTGGRLPASYVIHTVGPIWGQADEKKSQRLLADCYANSLGLALDKGFKTVAFPNISTGVYRFPKRLACKIALQTVREFTAYADNFEEVRFVCFDEENYQLYRTALEPESAAAELLAHIDKTFDGVPPPKINWKQADLLDDYINSGPAWEAAAQQGWKGRWQDIPEDYLRPVSALSFLKADGMLFYLPACMSHCLRRFDEPDTADLCQGTIFAFQAPGNPAHASWHQERFSLFSPAQKEATKRFIDFFELIGESGY